jgi:hypothetical protein
MSEEKKRRWQRLFGVRTVSGVTGIHRVIGKDIVIAWKLATVEGQRMIFAVMQRGKENE